jgi:hypothetical protein
MTPRLSRRPRPFCERRIGSGCLRRRRCPRERHVPPLLKPAHGRFLAPLHAGAPRWLLGRPLIGLAGGGRSARAVSSGDLVCGARRSTADVGCSGCLVLVAWHRDPDGDDGRRGCYGTSQRAPAAAPPRFRDSLWRSCAQTRRGSPTIETVSKVLTCCSELATCERAVDPGCQRLGIQARTGLRVRAE